MQKNTLAEWFRFSKRERNASFILLFIIALVIVLPYLVPAKKAQISIDKDVQQQLDAYLQDHPSSTNQSTYAASIDTTINDTVKTQLFFFDPNILNEEGFRKLGLPLKTVHTIINYRTKGGYFKSPEDIRKIYGLSKTEADRLIPYIKIQSTNTKQKETSGQEQQVINTTTHQYKKININTATADDWKTFPGIGDVLANRIIKFRTSIGGFKSVEQVAKTYGLGDSVFQAIKPYLYINDAENK
ncbi:MAG: helix-hairpin-helix domain-containing protein [Parafilimonas sp.]|nr:helix-hairpin-helix domain-containing protein [Parafilimonas sp.]